MEKEPMTNYGGREAGRIDWVDSLFTYGMVLVVLGHVILTDADSSTYLSHWIYGFHMPLFFWLAGVLFKNDTSIGKFALKKARRLLVPMVVLTCIAYIPKYYLSDFAFHTVSQDNNVVVSLLRAIVCPDDNPISLMWFLNALFVVYLIGAVLAKLIKDKTSLWGLAFLIGALGMTYLPYTQISFFGISLALYYFPYFCLGIVSKKIIARLDSQHLLPPRRLLLLFVILIALYCALICLPVNNYLISITGIFAAFALMKFLSVNKIRFMPSLRKYTYTIYLLQWFPMVAVRIILFQILGWDRWLCCPIMFLAGLYIPVLIGKLALRYIPRKAPGKYALLSIGL